MSVSRTDSTFKLKAYIGLDNRFVLCEGFPDNEEHAGLHEMLEDFIEQDAYIEHPKGQPLETGFYNITLSIETNVDYYEGVTDAYFIVDDIEPFSSSELEEMYG